VLKLDPLTVAFEMVILDPPGLFRVAVCVSLLPICTLPKESVVGLAVRLPAATELPVIGITSDGFKASLVRVRFTFSAPVEVGEKTTLNDALAPAATLLGRPLTV